MAKRNDPRRIITLVETAVTTAIMVMITRLVLALCSFIVGCECLSLDNVFPRSLSLGWECLKLEFECWML